MKKLVLMLVTLLLFVACGGNKESSSEGSKELYLFNAEFRQILFTQIEKVEINLRCRISNYFCLKYGVLGYKDSNNFSNRKYHTAFLNEISIEINRNKRVPFIYNFRNKKTNTYILMESDISFFVYSFFLHPGLFSVPLSKNLSSVRIMTELVKEERRHKSLYDI